MSIAALIGLAAKWRLVADEDVSPHDAGHFMSDAERQIWMQCANELDVLTGQLTQARPNYAARCTDAELIAELRRRLEPGQVDTHPSLSGPT
jgi:hypothetical protein